MGKQERLSREEFMKYFPEIPKKDKKFQDFVSKMITDWHGDYLIRTNKEARSSLYCTHCGAHLCITNKTPRHNKNLDCPECGHTATVEDAWRVKDINRHCTWKGVVNYYQKSPLDPKCVTCQGIEVIRDFSKKGNSRLKYRTIGWYLFRPGYVPQQFERHTYWHWDGNKYKTIEELREKRKINDVFRYNYNSNFYDFHLATMNSSFLKAIKCTYLEYCAANKLDLDFTNHRGDKALLLMYLDWYQKKPWLEMVAKLGLGALINHRLLYSENGKDLGIINWRANKPATAIQGCLTKSDIKFLSKRKPLDFETLGKFAAARKNKPDILSSELIYSIITNINIHKWDQMTMLQAAASYGITYEKIMHYVPRMGLTDLIRDPSDIISLYVDWINLAERSGVNLHDKANLWPRNLRQRQTNLKVTGEIKRQSYLQNKLEKTLPTRNKTYVYTEGSYVIRPIQSIKEIIMEGELLHHCVSMYADRYAAGTTDILVLRHKESLEKPYVTMEVHRIKTKKQKSKFELRQCYADHDQLPPEEVKTFVDNYIKKLNEGNLRRQAS
ncbi:MAG: PcfJ domain-containing protein [Acidaminococcaceae bacterium]|jgi:predicted RNA-binding Zn-ribbon protein involved in translation (DUF1610 family)|nr:PcfJ domain-containing protein [Acidaminococcaceae bacterium]